MKPLNFGTDKLRSLQMLGISVWKGLSGMLFDSRGQLNLRKGLLLKSLGIRGLLSL
jgi:hypothetical protein